MKPELVTREAFTLVGMRYRGRNENGEIPRLWNEFRTRMPEIGGRVDLGACYGHETYDEAFPETGEFTYLASVEVKGGGDVPPGLVVQRVPAHKYAVFALPAILEDLPTNIQSLYDRWLPESGLTATCEYDFEYFDQDSVPGQAGARILFYIPVK